MRTKIVAGNWKMNKTATETASLLTELSGMLPDTGARVMVAPTFVNLAEAVRLMVNSKIEVVGQNMHFEESGAFTGEISAAMLKDIGVEAVILGHSERRAYFGEDDALLAKKVAQAIAQGMEVIFCFGEELEERKSGKHFEVVSAQLKNALFALPGEAWKQIILAYEPVWAIGTGETASPEQAQEMHAHIRAVITEKYGDDIAANCSVLYGGSVKPGNAAEIFSKPDVDGGLIGGASLKADDFMAIVEAAS
ncbi:triosephosphate isomerase [Robiginitalea myxolifaciens]|uniref:Triosephosphate isomerase n=1 Tax=Robiginitalea myxolifaciens TaxID=400055 RepID=A0A1I6HE37_9FLAO|nr:triose-phosphate isomerase [Robiginitalea myxolifaciens]SFR52641.1 triosephosphate isomerase [Robiginitalea myxolifaciens]